MATLIVEIAIVGFIDYNIDVWTMTAEIKEGIIAPVDYMSLYSMQKVARAAFVCVGYFILNPLMLNLITKYVLFVEEMRYLWIFSIYGYSFVIFIVTTPLNIIPIEWVKWVVLSASAVVSLFFIISEMLVLIRHRLNEGWAKFVIVLLYLFGSHVVFILAIKLYFIT
jgi:hypothetical protein